MVIYCENVHDAEKDLPHVKTVLNAFFAGKDMTCPCCGQDLTIPVTTVDMYDHEGGVEVSAFMPKQWVSVRCHKCKYDVSINKLKSK